MSAIFSKVQHVFGHNIERLVRMLTTANGYCWIIPTSRKLKTFGMCCLLLCFALQLKAQAELRADSNHVETGNPFVLLLRLPVSLGKPDSLGFYVWGNVLPPQNIVSQTEWQPDGQFFNKTLTALFFDEDSIELSALPIALLGGDTVYSNALQIVVTATPSPDDLNDMAPIKDIHREPTHWTDYLPWVLGAFGIIGLIVWLYWLANRQPKTKIQSRKIETPAHELALKKLEILAQKKLIANGFIKEHYAELTFILREYLEKRFGVPALESTTEETLAYLKGRDFPQQLSHDLQYLLEQADLAKFAKTIPPDPFHTEAFDLSQKIIFQTSTHPAQPITNQPTTN